MASIRKRKNTFQITVCCGYDTAGKKITETTTFIPDPSKTEKQNQKALEKFTFEFDEKVKSGKYLDGEKLTFKDFTEIWFQDYANTHLKKATLQLYRHLLNVHIIPEIGHRKLSKILPVHLNKLYNTLGKECKDGKPGAYSAKSIKHVHNTISGIYASAVKLNIVTDTPCNGAEPPKLTPTRDKIKYFTLEQTGLFLNLLNREYTTTYKGHDRIDDTGKSYHVADYSETRTLPTQLKLFYHIALFCGLRRGELIALEWSDLDFNENSVNITKSTSSVNGEIITKTTKKNLLSVKFPFLLLLCSLRKNIGKSKCNTDFQSV